MLVWICAVGQLLQSEERRHRAAGYREASWSFMPERMGVVWRRMREDRPMTAPIKMTKEEMRAGFARGRILTQEEWANPAEIKWLDELVAEGCATVTPWRYHSNFQCEMRKGYGIRK